MEVKSIVAVTLIERPVNVVWEYFINPSDIQKWLINAQGYCCIDAVNDVRENGVYHFQMQHPQTQALFEIKGTYVQIIPQQILVATTEQGKKITTEFQQIDENTIVRETSALQDGASHSVLKEEREYILNSFKKYVESQPIV